VTGGLTQTASQAVKDAYQALKTSIIERLENPDQVEQLIQKVEEEPLAETRQLENKLSQSRIIDNKEILNMAIKILELTNTRPTEVTKFKVEINNSKGIVTGDGNTIEQIFND
jgi:hypothetical protein